MLSLPSLSLPLVPGEGNPSFFFPWNTTGHAFWNLILTKFIKEAGWVGVRLGHRAKLRRTEGAPVSESLTGAY